MRNRAVKFHVFLMSFLVSLVSSLHGRAADTISLNIQQAERIFLEKNLLLLSQKFFIEESKANEITARIYQNPGFHFEIGAYNPTIPNVSERFFNVGPQSQQLVNVSQLFYLAGKRNKRIGLAKINTSIAEFQLYDLLRTLRYSLRTTFFDLYGLSKALKFYDEEIPIIERTVLLYETQFNKGNLSLKEVVRLKSLLFSLRKEKLEYVNQITDCQQTLNILLQTNEHVFVKPIFDTTKANDVKLDQLKLSMLLDSAKVKRYDLKAYKGQIEYATLDYKYQKAMGVPDPTIGLTYDRNSNYYSNYIGPALDIPLPVFNRNQGNVQAAKIRIMENQLNYQYLDKVIQQEVVQSYEKAIETDKLYRAFDQRFTSDFDKLIDNVIANFEKRNITLIEFIDLYESYKATTLQKYQLQNDRLNTLEDLNFKTGSQLFEW